ncbi:hypothetical protein KSX_88140 [Ktedonospora formicarum]|uniref:Uncharacterized protein n=1 Tax=Ktedonospora formicarum TaxID=2778364 RepID=A0A8J3MY48_9CHLR|nr:hypothetical protein KSX_88140 [Ktedonospora formicarum]
MDEFYVELIFDKELPCVVCGTPTVCGVAFFSQSQGITGRKFINTWILNPYCERGMGCKDKVLEDVRAPQRD